MPLPLKNISPVYYNRMVITEVDLKLTEVSIQLTEVSLVSMEVGIVLTEVSIQLPEVSLVVAIRYEYYLMMSTNTYTINV